MAQWHKLKEEDDAVEERSLTLLDSTSRDVYFLTERLDWEGNVLEREGDERLLPIIQVSLEIQAAARDELDPEEVKRKAAPVIRDVLSEITGQLLDLDEIIETLEFSMDGSWRTQATPNRLSGPKPMKRFN